MTLFFLNKRKNKGFLVLTLVLIVCSTILIITTGLFLRSISQTKGGSDSENSLKALGAANACGEYALRQMIASSTDATTTESNWNYYGDIPLLVGAETCYIYPIVASGTDKIIKASSTVSTFTKKILIDVATNSPSMVVSSWKTVADFQ